MLGEYLVTVFENDVHYVPSGLRPLVEPNRF